MTNLIYFRRENSNKNITFGGMETRNYLDSTYLKTPAQSGLSEEETLKKVYDLAQEAADNGLFAVMIRPQYVRQIKQFLSEKNSAVKVGTVIGFHEGTASVYEKLKEAQQAIDDGADELDFVINYEAFKKGSLEALKFEFLRCTELCMKNNKVAKWIIEIAALTDEQIASITKNIVKWAAISFTKEQLSNIFIKSSTGFYETQDGKPNGATKEGIKIMLDNADVLPVKAAGGIRTKEEAVKTKEAVTKWIEERLKLEVSPEKTRIVNTRKRWSEFLGFKIRVRSKSHKYVVQSAICDKKVEIETDKLVEQAKNIAKPRKTKSCLSEIQLFNSMVLGIQNYYQLATCISIDCRNIHRRIMTVLTNRLNTEKGCMLKRDGGTVTETEKERFGNSKMIRYVSGIDQMIYPIAYIKNKIPMAKKSAICSYTSDGRELIHTELKINRSILKGLRERLPKSHSTEYYDCRISLFSAQKGKCAVSGDEFTNVEDIATWLKTPKELGGYERYKNMTLIHKKYQSLLEEQPLPELKALTKRLKTTKKMMIKINSLREQAALLAIE